MLIFPRVCRSPIPISSRQVFTLPVLFHSTLFFSDDYPLFLHNGQSTTFWNQLLAIHLLPLYSTPFLSYACALFCTHQKLNSLVFKQFRTLLQKTSGWGMGVKEKIANGETRTWRASPIRPARKLASPMVKETN